MLGTGNRWNGAYLENKVKCLLIVFSSHVGAKRWENRRSAGRWVGRAAWQEEFLCDGRPFVAPLTQ